jgi:prepilin-type N-terminal cleavage/methylation domain-containing protein
MRPNRFSSSGYTLIETIIVMAILVILAAIGAPHVSNATNRYKAELAARQIAADLNLARAHAKASSSPQTVSFNPSTNSYTMTGIESLDGRSPNYTLNLSADPYRSMLVSANFKGTPQVTFDAYGSADNGGTIIVQCAGIQNTVTLEPTSGRATVP